VLRQTIRLERRNRSLVKGALLVIVALVAFCARADVNVPDTPAGHTLLAFFDAFNTADHDRIAVYVKQYDPENDADNLVSFSNQTGGFTLVSIVHSAPDRLTFLVHGRKDNIDAYGILQLAATQPPRVKRLNIRALPPGAKPDDIQLDAETRRKTIDAISSKLADYYVYPDVAAKMIQAIREHEKQGDYNSLTDGNDFADALRRDLVAVSQDKHLFVNYNPFTLPEQPGPSSGPHPAKRCRAGALPRHAGAAELYFFQARNPQSQHRLHQIRRFSSSGYVRANSGRCHELCGPHRRAHF
jgi:hypothetical protein